MRKPYLALALCGAVLLVPLSAPPVPPGKGREVTLSVGTPEPFLSEPAALDIPAESAEAAPVLRVSSAPRTARLSAPATVHVAKAKPAAPATTTTVRARQAVAVRATLVVATSTPVLPPKPPAPPAPPAPAGPWDALAECESHNTNDHNAPYYGYWQFSEAAWHSVGERGLPDQTSRARQLVAAKKLQAAQGWEPWHGCAHRLGLN